MIKGCLKRVIVVKDTGSDLFEEAYFIVSQKGAEGGCDLLSEAKRIVAKKAVFAKGKRKAEVSFPNLLAGFLFGAVSVGVGLIFFI